jgi:hypothetical protein
VEPLPIKAFVTPTEPRGQATRAPAASRGAKEIISVLGIVVGNRIERPSIIHGEIPYYKYKVLMCPRKQLGTNYYRSCARYNNVIIDSQVAS